MTLNESVTIVFTDGACSGNPGPGGWGTIIATADAKVIELGGAEEKTTNNRMELQAALAALQFLASTKSPIRIFTDSKYLVDGITGWVFGWKRNGWKTAQGNEVLNRDLWEELAKLIEIPGLRALVEWVHIPGHSNIPGNERCDEIAVSFAEGNLPNLFDGKRGEYPISLDVPDNIKEKAKWRSQNKKGQNYYLSYLDGSVVRHTTWAECEARVKGRAGAKYQKCAASEEEVEILRKWGAPSPTQKK